MDAIIRFLQDTGFYLFSQDGNWRCLIMLGIACVLLYLGIVKKFEPLLLVPIAFGMLITNLPGANMFHEIFFAGGHIHWDLIGGQPVTASLLADLHSQGVAENVLAPYIQQLMTAAQTAFSPEMVEQAIAAVTEEAGAAITALEAQLQALVQAEQAAAYYGMTLSDITITPGLVDILYLGVKLGIYPCLIFMGVGAMTDFGPLIANPKSLLLGAAAQLGIFITFVGCRLMGFTGSESSAMAYKRNPMRSERICSLSRYLMADAANAPMTASVQWLERTLDDSANRRISLPEGFLCADAVLRLCQNVTNGLHVNEKIVDRAIREYLPFLATENIMMEAVKRGGDRQELHEKIRQHSMAATARMKEGESCDLLDRLAADPAFGMTRAELDAVMEPSLYIGRCKEQVERLLAEYAPLLTDAQTADGAISL